MKRPFLIMVTCSLMQAHADTLVISPHFSDEASDQDFSVMVTRFENFNQPSSEPYDFHYETPSGTYTVQCNTGLQCVIPLDIHSGLTVLEPTASEFSIVNDADTGYTNPIPGSTVVNATTGVIDDRSVMQAISQQADRDSQRTRYQFDRIVHQRLGWEMRNGEDVQQLSVAIPSQWPISVNLSQERVGQKPRTRLDMVGGQSWQQGLWRFSIMASVGAGDLDGASSHWYGAGFDAWFTEHQSGPFIRLNQQFSDEAGRWVDGLTLSAWQSQSLLSSIGWRHQQRVWGMNWDAAFGVEKAQNSAVGMVGFNNQWQAIGSIPDQQGAFLSLGVGNRSFKNQWRVGFDHFRDDTQLVLNWGW